MRIIKLIAQRRYYFKRVSKINWISIALKFHCVRGSQCNIQQYHFTYTKKHRTFWVRELCLFNGNTERHIAWGLY